MTQAAQKLALITGASSGIGAGYADRLSRRGYDVILVARDKSRLEILAERLRAETGRSIQVVPADLADREQLMRIEQLIRNESRLTLLVNNAGIGLATPVVEVSADRIAQLVAVNVMATAILAHAAVTTFAARGHGAIINMASIVALTPEVVNPVYSASKAFILNMSHGLTSQFASKGVHIQVVLPGATRTEIFERAGEDLNAFPPDFVMEVGDLVDAALVGFDRGETVTIPPLADDSGWKTMEAARRALLPNLSRSKAAPRYRNKAI